MTPAHAFAQEIKLDGVQHFAPIFVLDRQFCPKSPPNSLKSLFFSLAANCAVTPSIPPQQTDNPKSIVADLAAPCPLHHSVSLLFHDGILIYIMDQGRHSILWILDRNDKV